MQRFKNILCVIEHAQASKPALDRAVSLAENNQANLTVIAVAPRVPADIGIPDGGPIYPDLQAAIEREHEALILSLIEPYRQRLNIKHGVLIGTAFLEIIRSVLRNGHDLVVKCPESPSWLDRVFSGDDMHLLRKCPCPVWLIKPEAPKSYQRILAAVDVSEGYPPKERDTRRHLNVQILEMAASLAISESAELHFVHAWQSLNEMASGLVFASGIPRERLAASIERERQQQQQLLDDFIRNVMSNSQSARDALEYLQPRTHLLNGAARKEIPALARRLAADCIVMGTVARTGVRGFFMGNTAETILEQIDCSVVAIKPDGLKTPVTLDE